MKTRLSISLLFLCVTLEFFAYFKSKGTLNDKFIDHIILLVVTLITVIYALYLHYQAVQSHTLKNSPVLGSILASLISISLIFMLKEIVYIFIEKDRLSWIWGSILAGIILLIWAGSKMFFNKLSSTLKTIL